MIDQSAYILRVRQEAQQYARELLEDNRRLRFTIVALESENARLRDDLAKLRGEEERQRARGLELAQGLEQAEAESRERTERCFAFEREIASLSNLYVAMQRLHGSRDRDEMLVAIQEIVTTLVGSEEMALFELGADGNLVLVSALGVDAARWATLASGHGIIGGAAASGERWIAGQSPRREAVPGEERLSACIPLEANGRVVGALAVFGLLPQKPALEPADLQVLELLGAQAGCALGRAEPRGAASGASR